MADRWMAVGMSAGGVLVACAMCRKHVYAHAAMRRTGEYAAAPLCAPCSAAVLKEHAVCVALVRGGWVLLALRAT